MTPFSLLILILIAVIGKPAFSSTRRFPHPNFPPDAGHSLFGDAHFVAGPAVQLNRPTPSSFGVVVRRTPIRLNSSTSISSTLAFGIGGGISLVIVPTDFLSKLAGNSSFRFSDENRFFSIEFGRNACKIASSRVSNFSKITHVSDGGTLWAWVDYRAILKRLEVRLSKLGDPKPVEPLISHHVDLGEMWKGEEVLLGLVSSSGNSEQIATVYSWRSRFENVPKWLHSIPVNPQDYKTAKKRGCLLSGFVFALSCGALAAVALFFIGSYVADWVKIQGEPAVSPVDFKYEKIGVRVSNNLEAAKK